MEIASAAIATTFILSAVLLAGKLVISIGRNVRMGVKHQQDSTSVL